ncbi:toll-like receptor 6 [Haliotis cracherodii]|uniref:toll-like receptor 6 n=1 Tax=Haliotis cracherodii TaxID=6455 RepID=UPI0039EBE037
METTFFIFVTKLGVEETDTMSTSVMSSTAYVSSADGDIDFIRQGMLNNLEDLLAISLYTWDRDSLQGAPTAENIIDGIKRSRRAGLVLSRAFPMKKRCRFELLMANRDRVHWSVDHGHHNAGGCAQEGYSHEILNDVLLSIHTLK